MTTTCNICLFEYPESETATIKDPNGLGFIVACESCEQAVEDSKEPEPQNEEEE